MKFLGFIFALIVLAGCSKEVQKNKNIHGVWKPVVITVFDYDGLKNEVPAEGFLSFSPEGKKSKSGKFELHLNYIFQGNESTYIDYGSYDISNGNMILLKSEVDNSETMATIAYLTKEDLKFEIPNKNFLGYNFLMKKEQ